MVTLPWLLLMSTGSSRTSCGRLELLQLGLTPAQQYLGTIIDNKLTWKANTLARYSKILKILKGTTKILFFKIAA